jgi:hypothetical protein
MIVKELIDLLSKQDPKAHVIVYTQSSEDSDLATGIKQASWGDMRGRPYVKGDYPDAGGYNKPERKGEPVIIIK